MTDRPICGYDGLGGMCRERIAERPGAIRCTTHDDPRWMICVGCAGLAHRTCGANDICTSPICLSCVHYGSNEGHGRLLEPLTETHIDDRPPQARVANDVRKELIGILADVLRDCETRALVSFPDADHATRVAGVALDALTVHTTLKVLSGLTGAQE